MILSDKFVFGILTDGAEFFVDVGDGALDVGHRHDGMLIEREFLVRQFFQRSLAGGQAFLQRFLRRSAFGDVARDFGKAPERAPVVEHGSDHDVSPEGGTVLADPPGLFLKSPFGEGLLEFSGGLTGFAVFCSVKTRKMLAQNFLLQIALDAGRTRIPANHVTFGVEHVDGVVLDSVEQQPEPFLTFVQHFLRPLALGDIRADRHVLPGFAVGVEKRDDRGIHPVNRTIFGAVADFVPPYLAVGDGVVHLAEELGGMVAGVEDAVVLAQEFLARIFADGAELVVHVGDGSLHVSGGDDGVLVEGELLIG